MPNKELGFTEWQKAWQKLSRFRHVFPANTKNEIWTWGNNFCQQLGVGHDRHLDLPSKVIWHHSSAPMKLSTGDNHTLVLATDRTIWTWGQNNHGQLGTGDNDPRSQPTKITLNKYFYPQEILAGSTFNIIYGNDGSILVWGNNAHGQLGLGDLDDRLHPTKLTFSKPCYPSQISLGRAHTILLNSSRELWAWGCNRSGQLGLGDNKHRETTSQISWPGTSYPAKIHTGHNFNLVTTTEGQLWAWGQNNHGQLGVGDVENHYIPTPVKWEHPVYINRIAIGTKHILMLAIDSTLWAWGNNTSGQLGTTDFDDRHAPTKISWEHSSWPTQIFIGKDYNLVLAADGSLWSWGENSCGQLGLGDLTNRKTPCKVIWDHSSPIQQVTAGPSHVIAMAQDGTLWAWGNNIYGQLGLGHMQEVNRPMQIVMLPMWFYPRVIVLGNECSFVSDNYMVT